MKPPSGGLDTMSCRDPDCTCNLEKRDTIIKATIHDRGGGWYWFYWILTHRYVGADFYIDKIEAPSTWAKNLYDRMPGKSPCTTINGQVKDATPFIFLFDAYRRRYCSVPRDKW